MASGVSTKVKKRPTDIFNFQHFILFFLYYLGVLLAVSLIVCFMPRQLNPRLIDVLYHGDKLVHQAQQGHVDVLVDGVTVYGEVNLPTQNNVPCSERTSNG